MASRRRLLVDGIVQGVGFRPFVYNLARHESLTGFVTNTSRGVVIEIEGVPAALERFTKHLHHHPPPLARIVSLESEDIPAEGAGEFVIRASENTPGTTTLIPPDIAICHDCLQEIRDPKNRRFGYAFTNCTNCGPRWTIIGRIPYDRPYTSMAKFEMCPACQAEYDDPGDRRFHAQPNACPECGPRLWLADENGAEIAGSHTDHPHTDPLTVATDQLVAGKILAIKGLGGFHLAVRADDAGAVARLRRRKHREAKPLAVMITAPLIASGGTPYDPAAGGSDGTNCASPMTDLLGSPEAPIVLAERAELDPELALSITAAVAFGHRRLGVMLPYTPLHYLLMDRLNARGIRALVMTSGNASDEPICLDNDEALRRLKGIADAWLLHDRDILRRADDSVVQCLDGQPHFFRRSRGYAPVPVLLKGQDRDAAPVLAVGPELKNTVCLLKEDRAFLSPHIGDLENLQAYEFFTETAAHLQAVLESEPKVIAHDLHPGYFSTRWAKEQATAREGVRLVGVQHHHAHLVAVQAEHGITEPTLGLILDGTGYGTDGTIWGGEILAGNARSFERLGCFEPLVLPGGEAAIRAPWRTAVAALRLAYGADRNDWPALPLLERREIGPILEMMDRDLNCPATSSAGRLFDAVAALGGRWSEVAYEAQAAVEWMALTSTEHVAAEKPWPVEFSPDVGAAPFHLPVAPIVRAACDNLLAGVPEERISARFHATLIDLLTRAATAAAEHTGLDRVVLGGGVFLNEILLTGMVGSLAAAGLAPLRPVQTPVNDGAISLGQVVIARTARR